jgi:hypothetical protein
MVAVAALVPSPVPTVWIDASVSLEIDTLGDLYRELDLLEECRIRGSNVRVEDRRLRTQGAWWLAMALCKQGTTTVVSKHENLKQMLNHLAPPGTERGNWTAAVAWVFEPGGVFDGWRRRMHEGGEGLSDRKMDLYMIEKAHENNLTLITRDGDLIRKKGPKGGITPIRPEQYAASIISRDDARAMFLGRLARAVMIWVYNAPAGDESSDVKRRAKAGRTLLDQYRWIWEPAASTEPLASSSGLGARPLGEGIFDGTSYRILL